MGTWVGALGLLVIGATSGYLLGPGTARLDRAREAAGDLALPVVEVVSGRTGGEALREVMEDFVESQEEFQERNGRFRSWSEAQADLPDAFGIAYSENPLGRGWTGVMRVKADEGRGIACAAVVGRVPGYLEGIVLRRTGEVRCSRDLATRMNRLIRTVLPVGAWR